jgi:hypothetical protein
MQSQTNRKDILMLKRNTERSCGQPSMSLESLERRLALCTGECWVSTDVLDVSPDPRTTPVPTVDVKFSRAINSASFTYQDLMLTRDFDPTNLITRNVKVRKVDTLTYRISGLESATAADGQYVLTVLPGGITPKERIFSLVQGAWDSWTKGPATAGDTEAAAVAPNAGAVNANTGQQLYAPAADSLLDELLGAASDDLASI